MFNISYLGDGWVFDFESALKAFREKHPGLLIKTISCSAFGNIFIIASNGNCYVFNEDKKSFIEVDLGLDK